MLNFIKQKHKENKKNEVYEENVKNEVKIHFGIWEGRPGFRATIDERLVGQLLFNEFSINGEIYELYVISAERKKNIGRMLFSNLVQYAVEKKWNRITVVPGPLMVDWDPSPSTVSVDELKEIYKKLGFHYAKQNDMQMEYILGSFSDDLRNVDKIELLFPNTDKVYCAICLMCPSLFQGEINCPYENTYNRESEECRNCSISFWESKNVDNKIYTEADLYD